MMEGEGSEAKTGVPRALNHHLRLANCSVWVELHECGPVCLRLDFPTCSNTTQRHLLWP